MYNSTTVQASQSRKLVSTLLILGVIGVALSGVVLQWQNIRAMYLDRYLAPADVSVINEAEAIQYEGSEVGVEGVIAYSNNSRKQTIISFHDHHKGYFKALIKAENYPLFSKSPELLYPVGTAVRIKGKLDWYQGDQTMFITNPDQIIIL